MKKSFVVILLALIVQMAQAQTQLVLDGAYVKEHNPTRQVVPYPHLRQADVMWSKRIWEYIDLKQKINYPLYFPLDKKIDRYSLWDVIYKALVEDGSLTAYELGATFDDEFTTAMSPGAVDSVLNTVEIKFVPNIDTGEMDTVSLPMQVQSNEIVGYKLKEDWIFDKQRSERYVRIIGLAPMKLRKSDSGEIVGTKELFWLYFPECRYVFANYDVFNMHNDAQRISFDDLFQKRMFSAYVIKEENVYNRSIEDYAKGLDALLESERIKNDLFVLEHDLWHY